MRMRCFALCSGMCGRSLCLRSKPPNANFAFEPSAAYLLSILESVAISWRRTGRVKILARGLEQEGIALVRLQEARTKAGSYRCGPCSRIASGLGCNGNHGNEVWIHCELNLSPGGDSHDCLQPLHCCVLLSDPTCLVVRVLHPKLSSVLVSLHAPHRGHSVLVRTSWW